MCEVLLFVCSVMADETNLSSKLPAADRTREVWGRKLCWCALALAFLCASFCSASLIPFASYSSAPLLMRPRHIARSCTICSYDSVGMLKSLREALRVSLNRFSWPPCFFRKRSSGILVTWPVHLNCDNIRRVRTLSIPAFSGHLCLEYCLTTWSLEVF